MRRNKIRNHFKRQNSRTAFTLMEVILVLIILMIIGGISVNVYTGVLAGANDKATEATIKSLKTPIGMYQLNNGNFPSTLNDLIEVGDADPAKWGSAYIERVPTDAWGNDLIYSPQSQHPPMEYDLSSAGPDGTPNTEDDIANWKFTK